MTTGQFTSVVLTIVNVPIADSIAVVGPGAIGSAVAASLHTAGHSVSVYGRSPRDTIEVRPDDRDPIVVPGPVRTDPAAVSGPVDVVFLAVEDERVGRYCPAGTVVVPAAVWVSAETTPQGWVWVRDRLRLVLPDTPGAVVVAAVLPEGTVELDADFVSATWRKLLVNAVVGFMVLTGRRSGIFRRDDVAALARRYLAECLAVARAEGATLADAVVDEIVTMLAQSPPDITTSMLTDRQADRPLEWDIRNGVIARKAVAHGISTPVSDVLVSLLAAAGDGPG